MHAVPLKRSSIPGMASSLRARRALGTRRILAISISRTRSLKPSGNSLSVRMSAGWAFLRRNCLSTEGCVLKTTNGSGSEMRRGSSTNIVGVRIRPETNLKVYRKGQNPVLRGVAHIISHRKAYLWTKGWMPRLQTYPGREGPNPLSVEISRETRRLRSCFATSSPSPS
jgi:hypothetical protein